MIAIYFLATAIVRLCIYLYFFKFADIEICFTKGIIIGVSLESPELDGVKTCYLDIFLVFFILSFVWDEEI